MPTDFLATWDKSDSEIWVVLDLAQKIRDKFYGGEPTKMFESGLAVSIFKDKSTRTRYSYSAAANLVGLEVEELDEGKEVATCIVCRRIFPELAAAGGRWRRECLRNTKSRHIFRRATSHL